MRKRTLHAVAAALLWTAFSVQTAVSQEELLSTTLEVMKQRIDENVGQWGQGFRLYILWPQSTKGVSGKKLARPEGWAKTSEGSMKKKIKLTGQTKYTGRLVFGFLEIVKTKKEAVKGDKRTVQHLTFIEHNPDFKAGDPRVDAWTKQIREEYGQDYDLYVLWPRWLLTPAGWRDAFQVGGSLSSYSGFSESWDIDKAQVSFKPLVKGGKKREFRILEEQ